MIEFPTHKIILEVGDDREDCLKKVEISYDSQISLDELLNKVFRPILIALTYTNDSINKAFNMNEFGEELEEESGDGKFDTDEI